MKVEPEINCCNDCKHKWECADKVDICRHEQIVIVEALGWRDRVLLKACSDIPEWCPLKKGAKY